MNNNMKAAMAIAMAACNAKIEDEQVRKEYLDNLTACVKMLGKQMDKEEQNEFMNWYQNYLLKQRA